MISIGDEAAEHRQTCMFSIVVTYSCADVLDPLEEIYSGPASKPRKGHMRRLEWHAQNLALNAKAPVTVRDVKAIGAEIGDVVAMQMLRDAEERPPRCPATMLLGLTY